MSHYQSQIWTDCACGKRFETAAALRRHILGREYEDRPAGWRF
jgi:hypothetical protein